ncbi:MAG: hypothetical protein LBT65_07575 [Synergistaceae bacterium]|jgi:vacuolar-type H+-ATPase subunit E/Vma4|nr:hypothetical protein [Synergistaceae bacterium]
MQDLSGFREALAVQRMERTLALKRAVDEEIADIITARRLEVEGVVHRLRRASAAELNAGLSASRRYGERRMRSCRIELRNAFFERMEDRIAERLRELRSSRGYGQIMAALAKEAAENLSPPFVALVERGDAVFLRSDGDIREVREDLENVWGGLVLTEAEGRGLVDNTFRTRWKRLRPSLAGELHERLESALKEEAPDPRQEAAGLQQSGSPVLS